jgi:hypothetical protein
MELKNKQNLVGVFKNQSSKSYALTSVLLSVLLTFPYAGQGVFLQELNIISTKRDKRANFDFIQ